MKKVLSVILLAGMLSGAVEPFFGILTVLVAAGVRPLMPWLLSRVLSFISIYVTTHPKAPAADIHFQVLMHF